MYQSSIFENRSLGADIFRIGSRDNDCGSTVVIVGTNRKMAGTVSCNSLTNVSMALARTSVLVLVLALVKTESVVMFA